MFQSIAVEVSGGHCVRLAINWLWPKVKSFAFDVDVKCCWLAFAGQRSGRGEGGGEDIKALRANKCFQSARERGRQSDRFEGGESQTAAAAATLGRIGHTRQLKAPSEAQGCAVNWLLRDRYNILDEQHN